MAQGNFLKKCIVHAEVAEKSPIAASDIGVVDDDEAAIEREVQLQGRLTSIQEFENIILRTTDAGGMVRFKDVGRVELGGETYGIDAMDLKGTPSVGIAIYQLSGSNAIEVSNGVKEVLNEFEQTLPVGLGVQKIYDTTDFINQSIKGVTNSLRDAVILVVLILFLFLQKVLVPFL